MLWPNAGAVEVDITSLGQPTSATAAIKRRITAAQATRF